MIYTLGRIFFPTLIHQEKKLRARMRLLAVGCGVILVLGTAVVILRLNKSRLRSGGITKPLNMQTMQPVR